MKRSLLACLFLLPSCNQPEPDEGGADDVATSSDTTDSSGETGESTGDDDGDTMPDDFTDGDPTGEEIDTTGEGDTTGDTTDADTTGEGDTTTDDTTGDGDTTTDDGEGGTMTGDGDGDACPSPGSCNELLGAFQTETAAIRHCDADSECGQVLQGTSCGCTRDWVARLDADTTCFYELIDQANVLQCDLGLFSSCDCPEANGYACVDGICSWNYL